MLDYCRQLLEGIESLPSKARHIRGFGYTAACSGIIYCATIYFVRVIVIKKVSKKEAKMEASEEQLKEELKRSLNQARFDAFAFTGLTLAMIPILVIIVVLLLAFVLAFIGIPVIDFFGYGVTIATGVNLCVTLMAASYFFSPKIPFRNRKDDRYFVGAGLVCGVLLLALTYGTSLVTNQPWSFWFLYAVLAIAMVGFIGHVYEPKPYYYLGWTYVPTDIDSDPAAIENNEVHVQFPLGYAMELPYILMRSYGETFGSAWVWQSFSEKETSAALKFLQALGTSDWERVRGCADILGKPSLLKVVRALVKTKMVATDQGRIILLHKGKELLRQN
jgi:hypothetical protein